MKEFFKGVDIIGVVEGHAKAVTGMQDDQARKLASAYSEVRKDLIERLQHARINSFTAHRLKVVLVQVDAAIDAVTKQLGHTITDTSEKISIMGVQQLIKEINKFDDHFKGAVRPINLNIVKSAMDTSAFLINHYKKSLAHYGSAVKMKISTTLRNSVIAELPYSQVIHAISEEFKGQEWEVHRLARTELHHIYSTAKLNGMKDMKKNDILPTLKKALYHPMDSRTGEDSIEMAKMNPIIDLNEFFEQDYQATPKSKVQHRSYLVPPDRPNDRSILIPADPSWIK